MIRFVRQGNTYQMVIENGHHLEKVLSLDEAIWVAMSAPNDAFLCDQRFLEFIDSDSNGTIGSEELKQAIRWLLKHLPDHSSIVKEFDGKIALEEICQDEDTGKALVNSAKYILRELGHGKQDFITLAIIREFQNIVKSRPLNGDGILSLNSSNASEVALMKDFLADAITATGGVPDADGTQGVNLGHINSVLDAIPAYLDWLKLAEIPESATKTELMSYGATTPELYALLMENSATVDHFFKLCRLLAFDPRLDDKIVSTSEKLGSFDAANASEVDSYTVALPIAAPNNDGQLPINSLKINPAFRNWWDAVCSKILPELFPEMPEFLTEKSWAEVKKSFANYAAYLAGKKGALVEGIDLARLKTYLNNKVLRQEAADLSVRDEAVANTLRAAAEVEKLLLYRANLLRLVNNFVSFPDLYSPDCRALFERGSLVIDGRWFNTSFPVKDLAAHQAQAQTSNLFILYVEIAKSETEKPILAIPVTTGSKGNLSVGKRGVFFDLDRKEYPALVVQQIENPVCLAEALLAPFTKAWSMTEKKIETWSSSSEKAFHDKFDKATTKPAEPPPPPPAEKGGGGMAGGAFLGISVAFAALGSAFAFISKTIAGMSATAIVVSIIIGLLLLLFPISLLAILKLRRQDLSSLLEGSGWAINSRMRLSNKLRRQFSRYGIYPEDAENTPKKRGKTILLTIILIIILAVAAFRMYSNKKKATLERKEAEQATIVDKAETAEEIQEAPAVE